MKKYFIHPSFYFLLVFLLISNCAPNETGAEDIIIEKTVPRTADDVRKDFTELILKSGINDITLETVTEGVYWNFRIIIPEDVSETNKKPLIFNLHGGARNLSENAHKSTDCLITPGMEGILDAYIISPNSNGALWFDQSNQIQVLALHDLATTYLDIDISKIAITGYSDGGNGSLFFSQFHPSKFSAAIPMATSYNTANQDGSINKINIPLYVIHGEGDQLFPLKTTENFIQSSIMAGSNIQFKIASGLDHYQPCDYVSYLRDGIYWLNNLWK